MESRLFGFFLDEDIQLDIEKKRVIRFQAENAEQGMVFSVVTLSDVQLKLLLLLLDNKPGTVVSKNDIMNLVWEGRLEYLSNQRLWYLIKGLRKKLSSVGISEGFISNSHGIGYFVDGQKVNPIFVGSVSVK